MASVPAPRPDEPLPPPGLPREEPVPDTEEEERRVATPGREADPPWLPEPYDPERETVEPEAPVSLP
jgi:hypothetical protein